MSDSGSNRRDEPDVFHAAVLPEGPSTFEDSEFHRVRALASRLRDRPLLPPHPQDATRSWLEVSSGVKLPAAHCAFAGCAWTGDRSDDIDAHIFEEHADDLRRHCSWKPDADDAAWRAMVYDCEAISDTEL